MVIDWLSYGVDADSAEFWDRYSRASKRSIDRENASEKVTDDAENIRAYCASFREFYKDLIGEENADELLKDVGDNKREMDSVYESLLSCIYQQKMESRKRMASILIKYAPKRKQEESHDTSAV